MSEVAFSLGTIYLLKYFMVIFGIITIAFIVLSLKEKSTDTVHIIVMLFILMGSFYYSHSYSFLSTENLERLTIRKTAIENSVYYKADLNKLILNENLTENERFLKNLMELRGEKESSVTILKEFSNKQEKLHYEISQINELINKIKKRNNDVDMN